MAFREARCQDRRWIGPLVAQDDISWLAVFVIDSVETPVFATAVYNISSSNNKHNKRTYFEKQEPF